MATKYIKVETEPKKKMAWSKKLTIMTLLFGFVITQECLFLMYLCIVDGYTATAAWLTAAIGLAEVVIGFGLNGYLGLAKAENTNGGITMEIMKKSTAAVEKPESPAI